MMNLSAPFAKSEVGLQRPYHYSRLVGAGRLAMDCPRGSGIGRVIKLFDKISDQSPAARLLQRRPPSQTRPRRQLRSQLTFYLLRETSHEAQQSARH